MDSPVDLLKRLVHRLPGMAYRCRHDTDWTLEFVSEGSTKLLGYTPRQLVEDREVAVSDLIHPDDLAGVSLSVEAALSEGRPFSMTYRMRTADGEEKHVSELGRGILRPDGCLEALEGFLWDVTAHVEAQAALRDVQRRELVGGLAAGIAHDFNNLLTALYGTVDLLLLDKPAGHPDRGRLKSLIRVVDEGKALTRQLMQLGRGPATTPVGIDLRQVLDAQRELLVEVAGGATLMVSGDLGQSLVAVAPERLRQLVLNLVGNARDAQGGVGRIEVGLAREGDYAVLSVRDEGPGIAREHQEKVFEPYFTTKGERGTGLGLAVVREVAEEAGGRVEIESSPGQGACFRALFPLLSDAVPDGLPHERPVGTEIVLLVEDDAEARRLVARALRRLGYTLLEAPNGAEALRLSARHKGPIHLLVADARMPVLGGIDLARTFERERPEAARVLLTGEDLEPPEGLFAAVLRKPFGVADLGDRVRELLDGRDRSE